MQAGLVDQRALRGRGRPAAREAAPEPAPQATPAHWFTRIRDGRQIGRGNDRDAASSEDPSAGTSQPSQIPAREADTAERDTGASHPAARPIEVESRDFAVPPSGQVDLQCTGRSNQEPSDMRFDAKEFQPGQPYTGEWEDAWGEPSSAPSTAQAAAPSMRCTGEPADVFGRGRAAEENPWEESWHADDPPQEGHTDPPEPWETGGEPTSAWEPIKTWDPWEENPAHDAGAQTATPSSTPQPQSHQGSAQDPASQEGSPTRPVPCQIPPSDEAAGSRWVAKAPASQTAQHAAHPTESAGAPRTPVGPPAQCVKTLHADDANFVSVECGDRMVLTYPEENGFFGCHNTRTRQEGWLPTDAVDLPPEDRDPAAGSPPAAMQMPVPALNGHTPAPEPVPVRVGMTVQNSRGQTGIVHDLSEWQTGHFKVDFGNNKVWKCKMEVFKDEFGRSLAAPAVNGNHAADQHEAPVLNGVQPPASSHQAPVLNGVQPPAVGHQVLNGHTHAHVLSREPRHDTCWETFTDPNSNSLWFWHSESKDWFFGQMPLPGWERFESDTFHWWWHEESHTFFFEKPDKPSIVGGS
eukprot:s1326_g3.t2